MEATPFIAETDRVLIRLPTETDISPLATIWTDERVTRFMGGPRDFKTLCASFRQDLAAPPSSLDLWPVVEKTSGAIIGHCGLLPKTVDGRDEIELIYVLAAAFWGRGYATEAATALRDHAFRDLKIPRLVSLIDPANTASERVALKLGLNFETSTIRPNGKTLKLYALAAL